MTTQNTTQAGARTQNKAIAMDAARTGLPTLDPADMPTPAQIKKAKSESVGGYILGLATENSLLKRQRDELLATCKRTVRALELAQGARSHCPRRGREGRRMSATNRNGDVWAGERNGDWWLYRDSKGNLYESREIPAYRIVMDKAVMTRHGIMPA